MKKRNPLKKLWNFLGVFGGVLSLSNMAQTWVEDFIQWKYFLVDIFLTYKSFAEELHKLILWIGIDLSFWAVDYLIFGFIVSTSFSQALIKTLTNRAGEYEFGHYILLIQKNIIKKWWISLAALGPFTIMYFVYSLFWPILLFRSIYRYVDIKQRQAIEIYALDTVPEYDVEESELYLYTYQQICAIVLGTVVIISINLAL